MKKTRSAFLGSLGLLVVLVMAVGCYKPAAPDVTPTSAGGAEATTSGEVPDIEATAIVRSTQAAATMAAQTPEAVETEEEATQAPAEAAATATPESTVAPTTAAETPAPTSVPTAEPASETSGGTTYTVQAGDTVFSIATRHGTTVDAIAQANGLGSSSLIYVGQVLTIPSPGQQPAQPSTGETVHVVKQGEWLYSIGRIYNVSPMLLAEYNGIPSPYTVYPGQVIKIPAQ